MTRGARLRQRQTVCCGNEVDEFATLSVAAWGEARPNSLRPRGPARAAPSGKGLERRAVKPIGVLAASYSGLLFGLLVAPGCGPSVQSIYEGNVRFEHCYRLDLETDVAPTHRQACWTAWLDRYTYGQSRDRIEYARRRVRAFASGDTNRPVLEGGTSKADQESRQFYLVVPAPTSVHAPPPPIATRVNLVQPPPSAASAGGAPGQGAPGEECAAACRNSFTSCNEACAGEKKGAACKSCDPDYKKCMQRCFE